MSTGIATTEERAEYTDRIEQRIRTAVRSFQDLELEQMRKGEIRARARLAEVKGSVDTKREQARKKLRRAREASASAWTEAQTGLEAAWGELREAVERAHEHLSEADEEDEGGDRS